MDIQYINFEYKSDDKCINIDAGKYDNQMIKDNLFMSTFSCDKINIDEYRDFITKVNDFENAKYHFNEHNFIKYYFYESIIELRIDNFIIKFKQKLLQEVLRTNITNIFKD